ncbi:hypothetical protein [Glycomyces buryatensis]|uniref:hypothetical protein n=1 Tax=Glycomyces buryatensis TaxID=2570927 RepID=UPI003CCC5BFE
MGAGYAFTALALVSVVGLFVDDRAILGENVWIKPLKFGFAFAAYCFSLAWLLGHLTRLRRFGWWTGTVFAAISVLEVGAIAAAAAAGTFSHFNTTEGGLNDLVQAAFQLIPLMMTVNLVIAVMVLFQKFGDRAVTAVVRWGLFLSTLGMVAAFGIVTAGGQGERVQTDANGDEVLLNAGHGVGDLDGGGMFLTGWSTTGGDMRVPHFIGLHGIQVLIIAAFAMSALAVRHAWLCDDRTRARIVHSLALGTLGLFATTSMQALRGQSFVHPDAVTLAGFSASAAITIAGIAWAAAVAKAEARKESGTESGLESGDAEPVLTGFANTPR